MSLKPLCINKAFACSGLRRAAQNQKYLPPPKTAGPNRTPTKHHATPTTEKRRRPGPKGRNGVAFNDE
ncbi:hypothetical protein DMV33_20405 [Salmonella enterica subsp. enterica serovar Montevideo]|nr:hypothetical protein [Salmonella enterica subsp. enterica serovar Montevideo]